MVREVSGATRAEILKGLWVPMTHGTDKQMIGDHPAYLINLATEYAAVEIYIPPEFTTLRSLFLIGVGVANNASMDLTLDSDYGTFLQQYNNHSESVVAAPTTAVGAIFGIDLLALGIGAALADADVMGIKATFLVDTNAYFLGVLLRWY